MINIYYTYLIEAYHDILVQKYLPDFSIEFQQKVNRYIRWQDAQASLLGRILLCNGLKKLNKIFNIEKKLHYTSFNKPYFKDEKVKFNISHSGEIVVCVITETCEIGIDIEILQDIKVEDFKFQMTRLEWQRIISSDDMKSSFFDYWTQKEAVIKAHGKGLSIPLNSFEIIKNQTKINDESFFLKKIELDKKYTCHLASKNKICTTILPSVQMIYPSQFISSL